MQDSALTRSTGECQIGPPELRERAGSPDASNWGS